MAKCDQGYICEVCGEEVEGLIESALYLQYVIGWVDPETLHTRRECHLRCHPALAQFISDPRFDPPVTIEGDLAKHRMDASFAREQTTLVTRGYARLWEIFNDESPPPVTEYLLPEAKERWKQ